MTVGGEVLGMEEVAFGTREEPHLHLYEGHESASLLSPRVPTVAGASPVPARGGRNQGVCSACVGRGAALRGAGPMAAGDMAPPAAGEQEGVLWLCC